MKNFTAVIDGRFAGIFHTEMEALDGLRPVIKPGEIAKIYYEVPYSHLIAEVDHEDILAATR